MLKHSEHRVPTDVGDDTLNRGIPIVIGSRGMEESVDDIRLSILSALNTIPFQTRSCRVRPTSLPRREVTHVVSRRDRTIEAKQRG